MAHNPPIPARIDFADRLGVLIMDENRDYGGHRGQGGWTSETVDQEVIDMGDMVQVSYISLPECFSIYIVLFRPIQRCFASWWADSDLWCDCHLQRDRGHPSVFIWSFCNGTAVRLWLLAGGLFAV